MTAYHGGKQRIGLEIAENIHILSTILEDHGRIQIKGYCEPFCGMLGVYRHIPELFEDHIPKLKYKAGDANESVIKMWQSAQKGWKPPTLKYSKSKFMQLAGDGKSSAEKGFVGHFYGYMGKYFKPFRNDVSITRIQRSAQRVSQMAQDLSMVLFSAGGYSQFSHVKNYIIYCDPPYEVQNYYYDEKNNKQKFDHEAFWNWCRKMSENNLVFVSEYNAPSDFKLVWEKGDEKLFLLYSWILRNDML
jgi:DNA adenine methylase